MDVNDIKNWTDYIANKNGRGYDTPDQFNTGLLFAETMFVATRLGLPEGYIPGKPTGQEGYPMTAKIEDDIRPYLVSVDLTIPSTGIVPIPPDYLRRSSMSSWFTRQVSVPNISLDCDQPQYITKTVTREVNVDFIFNQEFTDRKWNSYKAPDLEFPICTFYNYGIEFAPVTLGSARFDYISVPKGAYWGWNDVNGQAVYDPSKSKQLQCPQDAYSKIVGFLLKNLGLNISNETVMAAGQQIWNQGG
jgi:hypothetical protein